VGGVLSSAPQPARDMDKNAWRGAIEQECPDESKLERRSSLVCVFGSCIWRTKVVEGMQAWSRLHFATAPGVVGA